MRLLFGIILGAALTVAGAFIYDTHNSAAAANGTASVERSLVNWDVVSGKWHELTARARDEWRRHVG